MQVWAVALADDVAVNVKAATSPSVISRARSIFNKFPLSLLLNELDDRMKFYRIAH